MRIWMAADSYLPAVAIGEVMRSFGFAEVVESRHPDYRKGDRVTGVTGLQDYVVVESARQCFQKVPKIPFVSDTVFLGPRHQRTYGFLRHGNRRTQEGRDDGCLRSRRRNREHRRSDWKDPWLPRRGHSRNGRQMQLAHKRARLLTPPSTTNIPGRSRHDERGHRSSEAASRRRLPSPGLRFALPGSRHRARPVENVRQESKTARPSWKASRKPPTPSTCSSPGQHRQAHRQSLFGAWKTQRFYLGALRFLCASDLRRNSSNLGFCSGVRIARIWSRPLWCSSSICASNCSCMAFISV